MYTTSSHTSSIPVCEYIENYVDIPTFSKACRVCPNYGQIWSCPPYDFDIMDYWKSYSTLQLYAEKIIFSREYTDRYYEQDELSELIQKIIGKEKQLLSKKMLKLEQFFPGSISLSAGNCSYCVRSCNRPDGIPCRFPEQLRYSIESLGGNVGMTIEKLMGIKLEWMEEGHLPHYFVLVNGLLIP